MGSDELKSKTIKHTLLKNPIDYYFHNDVPLEFVLNESDPANKKIPDLLGQYSMHLQGHPDDFVMDVLSSSAANFLKKNNIEIQMKVKDMPDILNIFGQGISIFCDYEKNNPPSLGENVTFFDGSVVFWGKKNPKSFSTRIEDGAVIGRYVRIPGYNTVIGKNSAILSINNYYEENNFELIMEEGSYIRSGITSETKAIDEFIKTSTFFVLNKHNKIHKHSIISSDVVFTGANEIPSYNEISKNVPLIFSKHNLSFLQSKT